MRVDRRCVGIASFVVGRDNFGQNHVASKLRLQMDSTNGRYANRWALSV